LVPLIGLGGDYPILWHAVNLLKTSVLVTQSEDLHSPTANRVFLHSPGSHNPIDFVKSEDELDPNSGPDHCSFKVSRVVLKQIEKRLRENGVHIEGAAFGFDRDRGSQSVEGQSKDSVRHPEWPSDAAARYGTK
jgi:hypothetical protein